MVFVCVRLGLFRVPHTLSRRNTVLARCEVCFLFCVCVRVRFACVIVCHTVLSLHYVVHNCALIESVR